MRVFDSVRRHWFEVWGGLLFFSAGAGEAFTFLHSSLWHLLYFVFSSLNQYWGNLGLIVQGDEATAIERLRQLELNSSPSSQKSVQVKENKEVSSANKPLVDVPVMEIFILNPSCGGSISCSSLLPSHPPPHPKKEKESQYLTNSLSRVFYQIITMKYSLTPLYIVFCTDLNFLSYLGL